MALVVPMFRQGRLAIVLRRMVLALGSILLVACLGSGHANAQTLENLTLVTASGRHDFQVEVMRTPDERAKGLMFRRFMPADRGMLFDFQRVEPVAMWMQNTYIPLDMIFIRADGSVARIAERAEPLSTRTIPSGEPVLSVLELNGGIAEKIGLKPGDKVEHGLFKPR
ncbi:MAG: DUF192 domain-containing protein [Bosea sp. (in: a-proteobacteria)]|jgi:uncharacterized membrane protein (UPF0127 family)